MSTTQDQAHERDERRDRICRECGFVTTEEAGGLYWFDRRPYWYHHTCADQRTDDELFGRR